jgi:hypothetical protein
MQVNAGNLRFKQETKDKSVTKMKIIETRDITGFLLIGLCVGVFISAGLLGTSLAEQSLFSASAPQTAQERAALFEVLRNVDESNSHKTTPYEILPYGTAPYGAYPYAALQNPYAYNDPQAALEQANTYKQIQKLNSAYSSSRSEDNWNYWTNMWLNGPQQTTGTSNIYGAMANPYAYNDPQAALEQANTYKQIQKLNSAYSSSRSEDNWYYWTNMWLNGL